MIDDLIALRVRDAAGPFEPDADFADSLYGELAGILGHAALERPRPYVVLRRRPEPNRLRILLVAVVVAALLLALVLMLAGTLRPTLADVPLDGVNDARTGIHPGPGPRGTPVEAWSLPVGTVNFSPVVQDGALYFGGRDRRMRAVDAVTGIERWSFTASDEIEGAAAVGSGIVAFTDVSGALFGVDAETGLQRWRAAGDLFQGASPALDGDSLYVGGGDGQLHVLDALRGTERWSFDAGAGVTAVTVVDETAYVGTIDGRLLAVTLATRGLAWPEVAIGPGSLDRIITDGGRLYAAATHTAGPGQVVAIDQGSGAVVWSFAPTGGTTLRLGALTGEQLYVTSTGGASALDTATGTPRWHVAEPASRQGLVFSDETLYVAADPRALVALDATTGAVRWELGLAADPSPQSLAWYPQRGLPVVTGAFVFIGDGAGMHAFTDASLVVPAPVTPRPRSEASSIPDPFTGVDIVAGPSEGFTHPSGMDVGPDGSLYVVDAGASRIVVIDADGRFVRALGELGDGPGQFNFHRDESEPMSDAGGVAVAADGTVYVADTVNDRVQAFSADGDYLFEWGDTGPGDGQFLEPFDLDVCPDGRVIVVDDVRDDIQVFDRRGEYLTTVGRKGNGPGELMFTSSVACRSDGSVLNADWDNNRVQAWDESGAFLWTVSGGSGDEPPLRLPGDVDGDAAGNVWVVDRTRVLVFDRERRLVAVWRPREHGLGRDPVAIVLDGLGRAYVSFTSQDLVVRLTIAPDAIQERRSPGP